MLIITRKINEITQIGENVTVKVVNIQGNKVELEITLPDDDIKNEVIKYDEEIQISKDVYIKVTNILGRYSVRLGITAPRNLTVIRIPKVSGGQPTKSQDSYLPNKKTILSNISERNTTKTRHYFFLNPYDDCAFTKCPKCDSKTKLRKFPLVIHIEPQQMFTLNKNCKYCLKCDLIIVKKSEIEALMTAQFEKVNPSIIGNEYLVFGTLNRSDWKKYHHAPSCPSETIEKVYVFKDVLKFEVVGGGWYR